MVNLCYIYEKTNFLRVKGKAKISEWCRFSQACLNTNKNLYHQKENRFTNKCSNSETISNVLIMLRII